MKQVFTDTGYHFDENDTEVAGVWATGTVNLTDHPAVTVTTTRHYDGSPDPAETGWSATGDVTYTVTESVDEAIGRDANGGETGTLTTKHAEKTDQHLRIAGPASGTSDDVKYSSETHAITTGGAVTVAAGASPPLTDTVTLHTDETGTSDTTTPAYDGSGGMRWLDTVTAADDKTMTDTINGDAKATTGGGGTGNSTVTNAITYTGPAGAMTNTGVTTEAWVYAFSNGAVSAQLTSESNTVQTTGTDPYTGADVSTPIQNLGDVALTSPPARDWFEAASNFGAAMGDKVSGGVTKRIRQGLGYDDVVNYNSRAYAAGAVAGEVINVGVQNLTPCRFVGVMRAGVRAMFWPIGKSCRFPVRAFVDAHHGWQRCQPIGLPTSGRMRIATVSVTLTDPI